MTKRIFLLNGLAIVALIINHAASWGYCAMFFWTDPTQPTAAPNYTQVGSLPYYALLLPHQLTVFTVPAFLFVSGFFVAYMSRGSQASPSWRMVKTRVVKLLIPYLIWSAIIFLGDALQGILYTPGGYLIRLLSGEVYEGYYFVPLLCGYYLLAPLLVPVARTRWRRLLVVSAVLTWGGTVVTYMRALYPTETPALDVVDDLMTLWLFVRFFFFFAFGLVAGLQVQVFKRWLSQHKRHVLAAVVILGALALIGPEVLWRRTGSWNLRSNPLLLSSSLYVLAIMLCLLAFDWIREPSSRFLHYLSTRTYGIYLAHGLVMELAARAMRAVAPWLFAAWWLVPTILFLLGLGVPLLLMQLASRPPVRRWRQYVFG